MAGYYIRTPDIREKARQAKLGSKNPNYKEGRPSCKLCSKVLFNYKASYCWDCLVKSGALKEMVPSGSKHYKWVNGVYKRSSGNFMRTTPTYRKFRKQILARDKACVLCASTERLEMDHIKPLSENPHLVTDPGNVRMLCRECHLKTDTFGGRMHGKARKI